MAAHRMDDRVAERLRGRGPWAERSLALWPRLIEAFDDGGPAAVKAMVETELRMITGRGAAADRGGAPNGDRQVGDRAR